MKTAYYFCLALSLGAMMAIIVACDTASPSDGLATSPIEAIADPVLAWSFNECVWPLPGESQVVAGTATDKGLRLTTLPSEGGGCSAELNFLEFSTSISHTVSSSKADGFGLALLMKVPGCPEQTTCKASANLGSIETGEFSSTRLWKYGIEVEVKGDTATASAAAYRESPYGGDDLPRVIVDGVEKYSADEWHSLALVVDRARGTLAFWFDGDFAGSKHFDDETVEHIDGLMISSENWFQLGDPGDTEYANELSPGSWRPSVLGIDDVRVYNLSAAQLDQLVK